MAEHTRRKAARKKLTGMGYAVGGHMKGDDAKEAKMVKEGVSEHEDHLHKGAKKTRLRLRDGGCAEGGEVKPRADRMSRGGKSKKGGHTTVNVVVAGQHPKPVPVPVPKPVPVPVNAGPGGPVGGPPPGAGPMPDPNAPPMGLKSGGRAKRSDGGNADLKMESQRDPARNSPPGQFAKGGRTKGKFEVPMKDGAGGGLGRIEKGKAYGA